MGAELDIIPHDRQRDFLERSEREVLFGGARGPGKSYALVLDVLAHVSDADWRGLLLRRSTPQLREIMDICRKVYPRTGAEWLAGEKTWIWPSGARLELAFCERDEDTERYQGRSFHWLGIDELGHWAEATYLWLFSCVRSANPKLECYIRCTANPLGRGHLWIKKRFVDPAAPGTPIWDERAKHWRVYIQALPSDNPYLGRDYIDRLEALPTEAQRRAFIHADWNTIEGAMFTGWRQELHVVDHRTFKIPDHWRRFRCGDFGFKEPSCFLWVAEDNDHNLVVYRELWRAGADVDELARMVREIEDAAGEVGLTGPLDPQAWERNGLGVTPGDRFWKLGVKWFRATKGPNSRVTACHEMHRRLAGFTRIRVDGEEAVIPAIRFTDNCTWTISTIPILQPDPHHPEDVLGGSDDHAWDALKYGLRYRPMRAPAGPPGGGGGYRQRMGLRAPTRPDATRSPITGY